MIKRDIRTLAAKSPIEDIAFLARSEHRVSALDALTVRPRSRSELCELTGVSSSTIRRTLQAFENRNWIHKKDYQYETTQLGELVATGMVELIELVETEQQLRDVWHWLPDEVFGFIIEAGSATTVTVTDPDAPYRPMNRFRMLLQEADHFQFLGIDVALLEPCREEFRQRVLDGMQAEIINTPGAARYILSTYPELCYELLESDNMTGLLHDNVPSYGVSLFDDCIAVNGYDSDSGGVKVLVDTELPAAREWAQSLYDSYRTSARPLEPQRILE